MANWGDPWGASWSAPQAAQESEVTAAPWGSAWGVPWSGQAADEESASGGGNGGPVLSLPVQRRKRHVNPDDEINKLVAKAMEGESPPAVTADLKQAATEAFLNSRPITTNTETATATTFILIDSDDDEALLLLLAA